MCSDGNKNMDQTNDVDAKNVVTKKVGVNNSNKTMRQATVDSKLEIASLSRLTSTN